jgi:predicted acylesterase/phospholipase RssA
VEDEKYSAEGLERILARELGELTTDQALTHTLVTAYDTDARRPVFIKRRPPRTRPDGSPKVDPVYRMRDAARATSAAPTYFEALRVAPVNEHDLPPEDRGPRCLVDGGVFNNNPALSAYVEARKIWGDPVDVLLVSLGTGITNRSYPWSRVKDWGAREWINPLAGLPLVNVMMDGQADAAHHHLREVLGDATLPPAGSAYVRLDGPLVGVQDEMDDASPENLAAMAAFTDRLLDPDYRFSGRHAALDQRHNAHIEWLADRLAAIPDPAPRPAG